MPDQMLEQILKEIGEFRKEQAVQSVELAKNTIETRNTVQQLTKLNGTVARHEKENIAFDASLKALETRDQLRDQAAEKKNGRTTDYIDWAAKGLIVILLLLAYKVLVTSGIVQDFLN